MQNETTEEPKKKLYLGDGLYAEFDGYQIRLWADRGFMTHEVFLEPNVAENFLKFMGHCWNVEIKVNKIGEPDIKVSPTAEPTIEAGVKDDIF